MTLVKDLKEDFIRGGGGYHGRCRGHCPGRWQWERESLGSSLTLERTSGISNQGAELVRGHWMRNYKEEALGRGEVLARWTQLSSWWRQARVGEGEFDQISNSSLVRYQGWGTLAGFLLILDSARTETEAQGWALVRKKIYSEEPV